MTTFVVIAAVAGAAVGAAALAAALVATWLHLGEIAIEQDCWNRLRPVKLFDFDALDDDEFDGAA